MKKTRIILLTILIISMVGSSFPLFVNTQMTPLRWDVEKLDGTYAAEERESGCREKPDGCGHADGPEPSDDDGSDYSQGGETVKHEVIDDT